MTELAMPIAPILTFWDASDRETIFQVFHPYFHVYVGYTERDPSAFSVLINGPAKLFEVGRLYDSWIGRRFNAHVYSGGSETFSVRNNEGRIFRGEYSYTVFPNPNDNTKTQTIKGMPNVLRDLFLTQGRSLTNIIKRPTPEQIRAMSLGQCDI